MDLFSSRLKNERKRLGLSQGDLASLGGVQRRAQQHYEKGERTPDAKYLVAVAAAGIDILYVLTGEVTPPELRERVMLMLAITAEADPAGTLPFTESSLAAVVEMPRQLRRAELEKKLAELSDEDMAVVEQLVTRLVAGRSSFRSAKV